jgi:RNase P/RNase MRP subunit POP5
MEEQRHQDLVAARVAEAAARAELLAAEEQHFRQLGGLIRKANTALGDGNTRMAAGLRRAIDEKITTAAAMPVYLQRGLQQLDDKLNALKEWKDYAVAPKRIELIEAMEALVGLDEDPQVLAGQIQSLQQDWRTISMGIAGDTSAEWERFHQAADQAYLPCREYFEAQAKRRADNLEQRKAVLARLNAFETAQHVESPDWRLIVTVLREAPQEWRRHFPVERAANRAVEAEFDAVIARLQVRLDTWYTRNAADKQSLIEQAGRLLALEDSGAAIDAVKKLQGHWRDAGPVVPREQDQRLWEDFRAQCDAVFQKRQQAYADYAAGLEANKARAIALCVELEQCAELGDATLLERAVKLPEWRSEFEALGELPRADARALYTRFERANSHCLAQLARQRERETAQAVMNLLEAGRRVQACERAVAGSLAAEERAVLKRGAEAFIASAKAWPKGGLLAVGKRLAAADALTALDAAANEKALRSLCIRGEILNESPTPPEDESMRRDYQMQKLVRGMGKGLAADDWSVLLLEWVSTGAVAAAIYLPLEARFVRCMPKQVAPNAPGA